MGLFETVNRKLVLLCVLVCIVSVAGGCKSTRETSHNDNSSVSVTPEVTYKEDTKEDTVEPVVSEKAEENALLEDIVLYLPDSEAEYLIPTKVKAEKTPNGVIQALMEYEVLPKETRVNYFTLRNNGQYIDLEDEVASMSDNLTAELDLSDSFLEALQHTGTAGEAMMMGAVVNSFCDNFKLRSIMVSSNDHVIETGHCIYDEPLTFYDELVE